MSHFDIAFSFRLQIYMFRDYMGYIRCALPSRATRAAYHDIARHSVRTILGRCIPCDIQCFATSLIIFFSYVFFRTEIFAIFIKVSYFTARSTSAISMRVSLNYFRRRI